MSYLMGIWISHIRGGTKPGNVERLSREDKDKIFNILTEIGNARNHRDDMYERYKIVTGEKNPSMPDLNKLRDDHREAAKNWYDASVAYRTALLKLINFYDT